MELIWYVVLACTSADELLYLCIILYSLYVSSVQLSVSAVFVQVGPALVFCTFLSAPIIYISARMALVSNVNSDDYHHVISDTRTDCSIVSIVSVVSKHDS